MDYSQQVARAIKRFWQVRASQQKNQGKRTGSKDAGARSAVTGGKHLDGFIELLAELLQKAGLEDSSIHTRSTTLPGYFRPCKNWDLIVVADGNLLASVEFKAQVGPSFGNNFNNRIEEALGSSTDLLTAYREGKFKPSQRPWLGWLMLLEETQGSTTPVKLNEPHYQVFPEFKHTSYSDRYSIFCERLMRERLYDATCLLLSNERGGIKGEYTEPNEEISFNRFATSLMAHAIAYAESR